MKRSVIIGCVSAALLGTWTLCADKVPMAQVPAAVQKAIKDQSRGEAVEEVEREVADGRTVYRVEFKRDGINRRVAFAPDGAVVSSGTGVAQAMKDWFNVGPSLQLNQVPEAVQKTIREQQAGRTIADLDKETWNGKTVYEVEFKEEGPNQRLHVGADGDLFVAKPQRDGAMMGTQLSDTPPAVQATVKRVAGTSRVDDVDVETRDGQTVYEIEIEQDGLNRHIHVAANGALLRDSQERERVRGEAGERNGERIVPLSQLPPAVQETIKAQGATGTLKPIKMETEDGRTVYKVEFEKEGLNKRMTIGADGRLIDQ